METGQLHRCISIILAAIFCGIFFPGNEMKDSSIGSAIFFVCVICSSMVCCAIMVKRGVPPIWHELEISAVLITQVIFICYATACPYVQTSTSSNPPVPPKTVILQCQIVQVFFTSIMCGIRREGDRLRWALLSFAAPAVGTVLFCVLHENVSPMEYYFIVFWFLPWGYFCAASFTVSPKAPDPRPESYGSRSPTGSMNASMDTITVGELLPCSGKRSSSVVPEGVLGGEGTADLAKDETNGGFFDSLMSSLRVPFFVVNTKLGTIQYWSPAMEDATSLYSTMATSQPVQYIFDQLQHVEAHQIAHQCLQHSASAFDLKLPDGTFLPMIVHQGRAFRCVSAHPCFVLLRLIPIPGCVTNSSRAIVMCNLAFARLVQINIHQCLGRPASELVGDHDSNIAVIDIPPYVLSMYTPQPVKPQRNVGFQGSFTCRDFTSGPMSPVPANIVTSLRNLVDQYTSGKNLPEDEKKPKATEKFCDSVVALMEGANVEGTMNEVSPVMMRSFAVPMSSNQSIHLPTAAPWGQLQSQDTNILPHIALHTFPDEEFKVGRGAKCQVQLHDPFISSVQLSITRRIVCDVPEKYGVTMKDYSANGTFVNVRMVGKRNKTALYPGDQITFRLNGTQKFFAGYIFVVSTCVVERPPVARVDVTNPAQVESRKPIKWKIGSELLGKGGNAEVFLGINTHNGKLIAVKRVLLKTTDERSMRQFLALQEEIDVLKDFVHPNIVQYLGTDQNETHLHVLLEFVPGGSIRHLVDNFGVLSEAVIIKYSVQIIEGLKYLHGRRVVHGDLKTANVLVTDKGEVKITDFGTAKVFAHEGPVAGKTVAGTLLWMAPELFRGMPGTPACDVWSFGCCLLEMMTAQSPWSEFDFENESQIVTLLEHTTEAPEVPTGFSPELTALAKECLQLEPQRRPSCETINWKLLQPKAAGI